MAINLGYPGFWRSSEVLVGLNDYFEYLSLANKVMKLNAILGWNLLTQDGNRSYFMEIRGTNRVLMKSEISSISGKEGAWGTEIKKGP